MSKRSFDFRGLFGVILIIAGAIIGIYVGIFLCFVGGIIAFIEAVQCDPVMASDIAWSIARVFFAGICEWISALVFFIPGLSLMK